MIWSQFIAWIDRSLGSNGMPRLHSTASMVPFIPLVLLLLSLWYFDPPAATRYRVAGVALVPTVFLFGIYFWRVRAAAKRYVRQIRQNGSDA